MKVIPIIKCSSVDESISFYTTILDFKLVGRWPGTGDPAYGVIQKDEVEVHLSSHSGDGAFENDIIIMVEKIDTLFQEFLMRGLDPSGKKDSPVHQSPLTQTWGTREFYVDDPSGNTIRFVEEE